MKKGTWIRLAATAGLVLFMTGCFGVEITNDVRDPGPYFARALREIESLGEIGRQGGPRARTFCLLAYDRGDHELVRLSVPMGIVEGALDSDADDSGWNRDFDLGKRYDIDWKAIKDLGSLGPGLLVSIDDDDNRVLIWLK